jgi:hypothetical protein
MSDDTTVGNYRDTFCTESGKRVLAHMLADSGFFDDNIKTIEEIAVLNYVKRILRRLGVINLANLNYFAGAIIDAPYKGEQEDDRTSIE